MRDVAPDSAREIPGAADHLLVRQDPWPPAPQRGSRPYEATNPVPHRPLRAGRRGGRGARARRDSVSGLRHARRFLRHCPRVGCAPITRARVGGAGLAGAHAVSGAHAVASACRNAGPSSATHRGVPNSAHPAARGRAGRTPNGDAVAPAAPWLDRDRHRELVPGDARLCRLGARRDARGTLPPAGPDVAAGPGLRREEVRDRPGGRCLRLPCRKPALAGRRPLGHGALPPRPRSQARPLSRPGDAPAGLTGRDPTRAVARAGGSS